jgi:hypothetical protein
MKIISILLFLLVILSLGCNSSILDDPSVTIRYQLPEESHVNLLIENSYKTLIAILVDEVQSAGVHEVSFDASDLAEGIYFYTVEMKGTESNFYYKYTKNLMLLK